MLVTVFFGIISFKEGIMGLKRNGFVSVIGLLIAVAIVAYLAYIYMGKKQSTGGSDQTSQYVTPQQGSAAIDKARSTVDTVNKLTAERYNNIN